MLLIIRKLAGLLAIHTKLIAVQGSPVDIPGYYQPDPAKTAAAMRLTPTPTHPPILPSESSPLGGRSIAKPPPRSSSPHHSGTHSPRLLRTTSCFPLPKESQVPRIPGIKIGSPRLSRHHWLMPEDHQVACSALTELDGIIYFPRRLDKIRLMEADEGRSLCTRSPN